LGSKVPRLLFFKLTFKLYRYTFVAKRTVTVFRADLKYKGLVYRYLSKIQGKRIPVYLGNISLLSLYFLDIRVRIVYILLILQVGKQADKAPISSPEYNISKEISCTVAKLQYYRVEYCNIQLPNML
jgi:hypothetical protein